jgi:hypothetical protein
MVRSVYTPPSTSSPAQTIATTRSSSVMAGSPWVQRSLIPRSAIARLSTTIVPTVPTQRLGA